MAGVKPSRGGLTGLHVWLIAFVTLWAASTTGLIMVFTGWERLRTDRDQAQSRLTAIAAPSDLAQPAIRAMEQAGTGARPARSLVRVMHEAIRAQAGLLSGNAEDDLKTVQKHWAALRDEIRSEGRVPDADTFVRTTGALPALRQMYEWYRAERDAKEQAAAARDDAQRQLEAAQAAHQKLQEEVAARLASLEKQVQSVSEDRDRLAATKTSEVDDLARNLDARKQELSALTLAMEQQKSAHASELGQRDQTLRSQADLLAQYRAPGPEGTNELDAARQPVGRVLRALPGDALVHIDLGQLDGVKLGLSFAVYSFAKPVAEDGRGKATIEVVSVGPHTAECRVMTPPPAEEPILPEDLVGNILLARSRARLQRFVVVGSFDIDYDGVDDPLGYDRVAAYIRRFGGEIVPDVDATVDYVVVGRRPTGVAGSPDPTRLDPTAVTAARRGARDAQHYDGSIEQARLLGIPRLRQDQFFHFIGLELGRGVASRLTP